MNDCYHTKSDGYSRHLRQRVNKHKLFCSEPQDAICGNEVVEDGEECDCGWEEDCKEPCCFPMRNSRPEDEPPCRLVPMWPLCFTQPSDVFVSDSGLMWTAVLAKDLAVIRIASSNSPTSAVMTMVAELLAIANILFSTKHCQSIPQKCLNYFLD